MKPSPPHTFRGRIVYFCIDNLPGFFFILGLIIVAMLLGQCIKGKKAALEEQIKSAATNETQPVNVVTLTLTPSTMVDKINLPGIVQPWIQLELMTQVRGTVKELFISEGDPVTKGQPIAGIESEDYRIALDSVQASYKLAQANFSRNKTLHKRGVSPQANLDEQRTLLRLASAAVQEAELNLSRCQITAPMSGVVSRLDAKIGLLLNHGDPVGEILQLERVKGVVGIPESDIIAVKELQEVMVSIQALDNEKMTAPIHYIAPSPTSQAHVYELQLTLENRDRRILPGMFLRADIVKRVDTKAIGVPLYAIISRNDEQYVYVEEDGIARKQVVTSGYLQGWLVQITSGLTARQQVIVKGHRSVEDGQTVKVIKTLADMKEQGELLP